MVVNNSSRIGLAAVGQTQLKLNKILEQLSSGKRINRASDDAAGLAIAEKLLTQVRGFRQASNNTDYAQAALQIGEGASNEISSILQRQREIAIQASNDTLSDDQRNSLDMEYQQLSVEIERIAESSQFNTQGTAAGNGIASGNAQVLIGANPGEEITLPAADFRASTLGTLPTSVSTATQARAAINQIDTAITNINTQRSGIGAMVNRLQHAADNLSNQNVNSTMAESLIRDMDFAVGVAELVRNQLIGQSSMMTLRNFNQISRSNMKALLG